MICIYLFFFWIWSNKFKFIIYTAPNILTFFVIITTKFRQLCLLVFVRCPSIRVTFKIFRTKRLSLIFRRIVFAFRSPCINDILFGLFSYFGNAVIVSPISTESVLSNLRGWTHIYNATKFMTQYLNPLGNTRDIQVDYCLFQG